MDIQAEELTSGIYKARSVCIAAVFLVENLIDDDIKSPKNRMEVLEGLGLILKSNADSLAKLASQIN